MESEVSAPPRLDAGDVASRGNIETAAAGQIGRGAAASGVRSFICAIGCFEPGAMARRLANHPLTIMLMMLSGACAAKSGQGEWAASGLLALLPIYFGTLVTSVAARSIANWVARFAAPRSVTKTQRLHDKQKCGRVGADFG